MIVARLSLAWIFDSLFFSFMSHLVVSSNDSHSVIVSIVTAVYAFLDAKCRSSVIKDSEVFQSISSKCSYQRCSIVRSTHSVIFNSTILVSISLIKALQNFDFVIASARLMFSSIHLISAIFLLSYDCLKHIKSIINRFSAVVSSLIKQSNKLLKFVNNINDKEICSIRSMIDFINVSTSKS